MKYGLSENNIAKIKGVFEHVTAVENAVLYCSRAKGNFKPSSDIDITLQGKELNLHVLSEIMQRLDDLLLPYKFDLSIYNHIANQELLEHINRVGKNFYCAKDFSVL